MSVAGRKVALVKPQSYMNVSGGPLKKIAEEYRVPAAGILVIHDELELPAGAVALKMGGGHAGHNGLRSIGEKLGTPDYPRVRCGIGRPPGKMAPADYVLQQLRGRDWEEFEVTAADAALAAVSLWSRVWLRHLPSTRLRSRGLVRCWPPRCEFFNQRFSVGDRRSAGVASWRI